jgi:TolB-like protein/Tfp pilus assembly protein PilF
MPGLFEELKRRNVIKVSAAYVVLSWLLAQVADLAADTFAAPDWVMKMFVTLLALGFPMAVFFAWAFELTPEGLKKERDVDRSQSITLETGRKLDFAIIAILVMALGYFAWDKFSAETDVIPEIDGNVVQDDLNPSEDESSAEAAETSGHAEIASKSIAVLPFVNMSSDPEQEYFSDGISEEILNALARIEDLKVAGRTSSFAFKGQNQDLNTIGQALRVAHILEGSVRKAGNQLRITAQLIKVEDGYHMWSETYDREMTDVFAIQDEISNSILAQLKARLLGEQSIVTAKVDPQAYAQYLLAKQRIYDRNQASLEMAADLLRKAVETDPGFAAAYAQLGIATILLSERQYGSLPEDQAFDQGRQYLDKALALDPAQAEALAGMGLLHLNRPGGRDKAIAWLKNALASDPNLSNASSWLASALTETGQLDAARELRERDFARDPLYMPVFSNLVQIYGKTGQHDKAQSVLDDLQPYLHEDANMLSSRGMALQLAGRWAEAARAFDAAYALEPRNYVNNLWYSMTLNATARYELSASLGINAWSTLALARLGRVEEALMAGHAAASSGQYPGIYFQVLVESGRHADLISFVEDHWTSLDAFEEAWPDRNGYGAQSMTFIAEAYRHLDQEEPFIDALQRARAANDAQLAGGADNWSLSLSRAQIAALSGDYDAAITLLDRAVEQGLVLDITIPSAWPVFRPLAGDPRFESVKARLLEHLNSERRQMGLEPLAA